jgi:hypothetical protein
MCGPRPLTHGPILCYYYQGNQRTVLIRFASRAEIRPICGPFGFALVPLFVTNGAFMRVDVFHLNMRTYFYDARRPIKFTGTPNSSRSRVELFWSLVLRARTNISAYMTFHSTSGLFLLRERTVYYHTRISVRGACGPSSFARTKMVQRPSRTQNSYILEDFPRISSGHYRFACGPFYSETDFLSQRTFNVS